MNGSIEDDLEREHPPSTGERLAEFVAHTVGSWKFICIQTLALLGWVWFNSEGIIRFDPYPFILLNLVLSLQAAYTAPMILMASNRQNEKDRRVLYGDYEVDREAEQRIERIEAKLDELLNSRRDVE